MNDRRAKNWTVINDHRMRRRNHLLLLSMQYQIKWASYHSTNQTTRMYSYLQRFLCYHVVCEAGTLKTAYCCNAHANSEQSIRAKTICKYPLFFSSSSGLTLNNLLNCFQFWMFIYKRLHCMCSTAQQTQNKASKTGVVCCRPPANTLWAAHRSIND